MSDITGSVSFKTPRAEIVISHSKDDETMVTIRTNAPDDTSYNTIVVEQSHDMIVHMMIKKIEIPIKSIQDDVLEE